MAAVPKLSSLQAQLRKSSAPKPSGAVPSQAQGVKRPAEAPLDGQPKKVAVVAKTPVAKTVPTAGGIAGKAGGLSAKLPPPSGAAAAKPSPAAAKAAEVEDIKALQAKLAALKQKANILQVELQKPKGGAPKPSSPAPTGVPAAAKPSSLAKNPVVASSPVLTKSPALAQNPGFAKNPVVAKNPIVAVAKVAPQPVAVKAAPAMTTSKSAAPQPASQAGAAFAKLPVKRPPSAPPAPKANGQSSSSSAADAINIDSHTAEALKSFTTGLKDHQGKAKLVLMSRLVESLVGGFSLDENIYFQKLCRRKVMERSQADGLQLPVPAPAAATKSAPASATKSASVAAATKSIPAVAPASTSKSASPSVPSTAGVPPRPAAPQRSAAAPPAEPEEPPVDAAVSSSNGFSADPPTKPDSPLAALIAELVEEPVCDEGEMDEDRLIEVLKQLWGGVAKDPKDWVVAWMAMGLPVERHAMVLKKLLVMSFGQKEGHSADEASLIFVELMKARKVRMLAVKEVLVTVGEHLDSHLAVNDQAWHIYGTILLHLYPKPREAGWGWSRVGWNWFCWWQFVEKCVASLQGAKAIDVLAELLRLVQEKETVPLDESWDGAKMKQVLPKICELSKLSEQEVISRLVSEGVTVTPPG